MLLCFGLLCGIKVCSSSVLHLIQALPLLAMIEPVDPGQLLQFITSFSPKGPGAKEETMEAKYGFLTYDDMTNEQKLFIDVALEEHEGFTEILAVQAFNELGETASIGMFVCSAVRCML